MGDQSGYQDVTASGETSGLAVTELVALQQARWREVQAAPLDLSGMRPPERVSTLMAAAYRSKTPLQRLRWLHKAADAWGEAVARVSACKVGCNHCCHIPVSIFETEAKHLAQASGRALVQPDASARVTPQERDQSTPEKEQLVGQRLKNPAHLGRPCPFLVEGRCSVYEARPLACRVHYNLDRDELLCQVVPGQPVQVPYADAFAFLVHAASLLDRDDLADIRSYFPDISGEKS